MASAPSLFITLLLLTSLASLSRASTSAFAATSTPLSYWPTTLADQLDEDYSDFDVDVDFEGDGEISDRRSLFWKNTGRRYYISYGALSANRIPCPPRSGRSYYTHNCFKARGPVHPYSRGCNAITRCRR